MAYEYDRFSADRKQRAINTPVEQPEEKKTVDLVKQTLADNGGAGLSRNSQKRIRNGLRKLARRKTLPESDALSEPQNTPEDSRTPDRLYAFLALFAVIFFVPSWVYPVLAACIIFLAITLYFAFGHDRVCSMILVWYRRLQQRDPEKAERLRVRAARISAWISRVADRLPERWTNGLYLPDFEPEVLPEKMHSDPFERFYTEAEG